MTDFRRTRYGSGALRPPPPVAAPLVPRCALPTAATPRSVVGRSLVRALWTGPGPASVTMAPMGPLGILGGGQLGRMTLQAASALGIDVVIAERFPDSPAARFTSRSVVFENGWDDPHALEHL